MSKRTRENIGAGFLIALCIAAAILAGCGSPPEPAEPDAAKATVAEAHPLLEYFPRPFRDVGPLIEVGGRAAKGADPELERGADGRWYVFHTWGPTHPTERNWPGIYRRSAATLAGPWSRMELVMKANDGGISAADNAQAQETVAMDYVPELGQWVGLIMEYTRGRGDSWLRLFTAPTLDGVFTKHPSKVVREFPWEAHYTPARSKPGTISEPSVVWSEPHGMLIATWATRSNMPDGVTWRNGIMASGSHGETWLRHPEPFLVAPHRFHERGTLNTHSQGFLLAEPRRPGFLHFFATVEGSMSIERKGITSWLFDGVTWHPNPNGLLLRTAELGTTHIGAPSIQIVDGKYVMVYAKHAEPGQRGTRLRMAEVSR